MTNLNRATADAVREAMKRRGVRQAHIAAALGLSQPAVSDRLRGRTPLTLSDLERIAAALDVDVRDLLQPRADQPMGATA